jgi:hypothetical protein
MSVKKTASTTPKKKMMMMMVLLKTRRAPSKIVWNGARTNSNATRIEKRARGSRMRYFAHSVLPEEGRRKQRPNTS